MSYIDLSDLQLVKAGRGAAPDFSLPLLRGARALWLCNENTGAPFDPLMRLSHPLAGGAAWASGTFGPYLALNATGKGTTRNTDPRFALQPPISMTVRMGFLGTPSVGATFLGTSFSGSNVVPFTAYTIGVSGSGDVCASSNNGTGTQRQAVTAFTSASFSAGSVFSLTAIFLPTQILLYLNQVLEASLSGLAANGISYGSGSGFSFGTAPGTSLNPNIAIVGAAIWNRALSVVEIARVAHTNLGLTLPEPQRRWFVPPPPPTTLYLRQGESAPSGLTLPSGYLEGFLGPTNAAYAGANAKALDKQAGAAQLSATLTGVSTTNGCGLAQFLSPKLAAQTVPALTWSVGWGQKASAATATNSWYVSIFLVNGATGAKRTTLVSFAGVGLSPRSATTNEMSSYSTTIAVAGFTSLDGDYLDVEVTGGYNNTVSNESFTLFTDGPNPMSADNVVVTNPSAFVRVPTRLVFLYSQALAASLPTSGALRRASGPRLAGVAAMAGGLRRQISHRLTGVLTARGGLTGVRARLMALTGLLPSAGHLTRATRHRGLGAVWALRGSLARTTQRRLGGVLATHGALLRAVQRRLGGGFAAQGALRRTVQRRLDGGFAAHGTMTRITRHGLGGTLRALGHLGTATRRSLSGSLVLGGRLGRITRHRLGGILATLGQLSGAASGGTSHVLHLAATLATSGTLRRITTHRLGAVLLALGRLSRLTQHRLIGSLGVGGRLSRLTQHRFTGILSGSGRLSRASLHHLGAGAVWSGAVRRTTQHRLIGAVHWLGGLAGALAGGTNFVAHLVASFASSGSLRRITLHRVSGRLATGGTLARATLTRLTGRLATSGTVRRASAIRLAAVLALRGALIGGRGYRQALTAILGTSGRLTRASTHRLGAGVATSGRLGRSVTHHLATMARLGGTLRRGIGHALAARLGLGGAVNGVWGAAGALFRTLYGWFRPDQTSMQGTLTADVTSPQGTLTAAVTTMQGVLSADVTTMQGTLTADVTAIQGTLDAG